MPNERPNPDELLERVVQEERRAKRGKLTVFFGAAPGRYETGALVLGLELLSFRFALPIQGEPPKLELPELATSTREASP